MKRLKKWTKRAEHIYALCIFILALTVLTGLTVNRYPGNTWWKIFCDGFSLCAVACFLVMIYYRPKEKTGKEHTDEKEKLTKEFRTARMLCVISTGITAVLLFMGVALK